MMKWIFPQPSPSAYPYTLNMATTVMTSSAAPIPPYITPNKQAATACRPGKTGKLNHLYLDDGLLERDILLRWVAKEKRLPAGHLWF
jgi:hypothetical protein